MEVSSAFDKISSHTRRGSCPFFFVSSLRSIMSRSRLLRAGVLGSLIILCAGFPTIAQTLRDDEGFGPVVRAYLGYLKNEQEVVDDQLADTDGTPSYYRRNSTVRAADDGNANAGPKTIICWNLRPLPETVALLSEPPR